MAGHPDAAALVAAVRDFLGGLKLDGRDAFHAKVAGNVLAIVERELVARPDAAAAAALAPIVPDDGKEEEDVPSLRTQICTALRDGSLGHATPGLLDALVAANLAALAVDNPRYSTFLRRAAAAPQR